jgi:hypothetical protein
MNATKALWQINALGRQRRARRELNPYCRYVNEISNLNRPWASESVTVTCHSPWPKASADRCTATMVSALRRRHESIISNFGMVQGQGEFEAVTGHQDYFRDAPLFAIPLIPN